LYQKAAIELAVLYWQQYAAYFCSTLINWPKPAYSFFKKILPRQTSDREAEIFV
jgi:hypothetical protein